MCICHLPYQGTIERKHCSISDGIAISYGPSKVDERDFVTNGQGADIFLPQCHEIGI